MMLCAATTYNDHYHFAERTTGLIWIQIIGQNGQKELYNIPSSIMFHINKLQQKRSSINKQKNTHNFYLCMFVCMYIYLFPLCILYTQLAVLHPCAPTVFSKFLTDKQLLACLGSLNLNKHEGKHFRSIANIVH